ncbi:Serac1 [Thalictrum thalictroides]|uniref:Serac1 n=1 Tax=Thalictrum thalictroides TaxID=46969 RepID=A0A7J6WJY7_THATH|nr:Serac1 [Thalictrum thalictroides]
MLRLCNQTRRTIHRFRSHPLRHLSSSSSPSSNPKDSINYPNNLQNSQNIPHLPNSPILHQSNNILSLSSPSLSNKSIFLISATLISGIVASAALLSNNNDGFKNTSNELYANVQHSIERSKDSVNKVFYQMKQTGVAATVLLKSLSSVLSSANQEVRSGFELRVASLLADIVAAIESRRLAIVTAGGGAVVDWLLERVAFCSKDHSATQAESARALAYLISDHNVCEAVLGRPHAVPNLLRFIFSFQPQRSKKKQKIRSSLDSSDTYKGRSMLVAAIMDIVTSNCDDIDNAFLKPSLPADADMRDIAAAIEVIEEGGMHFDEPHDGADDEDGGKGMRGIGIKILGGTTVLGLSRMNGMLPTEHDDLDYSEPVKDAPRTPLLQKSYESSQVQEKLASMSAPGLWDDLQSEHVAVPFAAWALANWALASDLNRTHIQELDQDGYAVMTALVAPERTVKWHGSLVARLLLQDGDLPLINSVPDWSASLLSTVAQASRTEDIPLAQMALSAFLVSLERSSDAQKTVMEKGLHRMRDIAKQTRKHRHVQEQLAKALELLCTGVVHLSLEESQKWSSILLPWVCGKTSTDAIRTSATNILSCILEDYGPSSIPISQGWITILLTETLGSSKKTSAKLKNDKVKTQIDKSNALSAAQIANQLAGAVVNLAGNQFGKDIASDDTFPLGDLLSSEPFSGPFKNLNKDNLRKFDAADSALATLKGIKALAEVCADDTESQNKIADFGVLCLLRRFLLRDDYEQLAANEAYDASRVRETQEPPTAPGETPVVDANDSSSVRVPPTAHIRRHAARLLNILSLHPKVQKAVRADKIWCKWLDDCANGRIPGCNDLKMQSYARATLLNIFCSEESNGNSVPENVPSGSKGVQNSMCPRYDDMIFLINPNLPHWKCSEGPFKTWRVTDDKFSTVSDNSPSLYENESTNVDSKLPSVDGSVKYSEYEDPLVDIVFIHGLRGGPFKTWRVTDDKFSTTSKSGLVEKIDQEAGKQGTFWPKEWLAADFPYARLFTVKYKTNLTQWSGASLPLQEVSSMLLQKLVAAGIGNRPVVFVTHSMGGLVVKQMLHEARANNLSSLVNNTAGVVFYSCPHFGSKLADMPWRMGLVLRPAPTIGELRSGSPRLVELNDFIRHLHKKGSLDVLSFSETKVTPIVEGYGGWAFRMEIVPIESAYPGFGELVVLDSTDHINSCKPVSRSDPSYTETLDFLQKLKAHYTYLKVN